MAVDEELAQLKRELAAERAKSARLEGELARERAENASLRQMLEEVLRRLSEVERRVAKDSHNSSKPPSSDGPGRKRVSPHRRSEKKTGGQQGHPGHTLKIVDTPDEVVRHHPVACQRCQQPLDEVAGKVKERRQVHDLPEVRLRVCEHQVEEVSCPGRGQRTVGSFPAEVMAPAQYGPNVQALAVYLHQGQLVPMARTCLRPRRGVRLSSLARNAPALGAGGIGTAGCHGGEDCRLAERGTIAAWMMKQAYASEANGTGCI